VQATQERALPGALHRGLAVVNEFRNLVDLLVEHPWASLCALVGVCVLIERIGQQLVATVQAARGSATQEGQ
jgi:hypothetical protein